MFCFTIPVGVLLYDTPLAFRQRLIFDTVYFMPSFYGTREDEQDSKEEQEDDEE